MGANWALSQNRKNVDEFSASTRSSDVILSGFSSSDLLIRGLQRQEAAFDNADHDEVVPPRVYSLRPWKVNAGMLQLSSLMSSPLLAGPSAISDLLQAPDCSLSLKRPRLCLPDARPDGMSGKEWQRLRYRSQRAELRASQQARNNNFLKHVARRHVEESLITPADKPAIAARNSWSGAQVKSQPQSQLQAKLRVLSKRSMPPKVRVLSNTEVFRLSGLQYLEADLTSANSLLFHFLCD